MIYCKKCAKKFSSIKDVSEDGTFTCHSCGATVNETLQDDEVRPLVQKLHKNSNFYRNRIDTGLSFIVIGLMLAIIGLIFYYLAFKLAALDPNDPTKKEFVLNTTSSEFWVFVVGVSVGGTMFIAGLCLALVYAYKRRTVRYSVEYIREHKTTLVPPVQSIFVEWWNKISHFFKELNFEIKTRLNNKKAAK
jgi:predicted nucleic acid-binding Zn ribbon protein